MDIKCVVVLLGTIFPVVQSGVPGTFFWKPRLGLAWVIPNTGSALSPSKKNVVAGLVVAIDGYQVGVSVIALAAGLTSAKLYPHLNPISAHFYTNSYRWALRHLSLIPAWLGGRRDHYCDTLKLWRRRFYYVNEFVPKWLRYLFPYVRDDEWKNEEMEFKRFKKYSESAFGSHYKYSKLKFGQIHSEEIEETSEESDFKSSSSSQE